MKKRDMALIRLTRIIDAFGNDKQKGENKMKKRDAQLINLSRRLDALGISLSDQNALRLIEMALHRWAERECNGEIERDEKTQKPYAVYGHNIPNATITRYRVPDKEEGALRRLRAIMDRYPYLWWYHQGDPRGCALYVGRYLDLPSGTNVSKPERVIDQHYTRGVAVCL